MAARSRAGTIVRKKRADLKAEFWPNEIAWRGADEVGYFCAPRSLPFVLRALREKSISHDKDPGPVYVDLLASHVSEGVIELGPEDAHAYAAGYLHLRSWRDRMNVLELAGFIKTIGAGNSRYTTVLLVHPTVAMYRLREEGKIPDELWNAYRRHQINSRETPLAELRADDSDEGAGIVAG